MRKRTNPLNSYIPKKASDKNHRHSNSGPPFSLIWSLPRLWYGSLSGSISLNHLSIFYNISCYNSLVLLTFVSRSSHRHSNSGPPFFPHLVPPAIMVWISVWKYIFEPCIHISIFYNISCYNSLVLLTFVSRSSCRITYIYIKVRNNRQNTKRESSLRLDILQ
jgi:hypothetical protein